MIWFLVALAVVIGALILWTAYVARGVERWVPMDGRQVEVPGVRIHYVEMGPADAPAIVMIHGIMSQLRVFTYALAGRLASDRRVIVMDRPGWGYSVLTGPRLDIRGQADAVAAAILALGLEKPLLVGHSMGGAVSLALAFRHPRPGWGYSVLTGPRLDIRGQADAVAAAILALGLEKPLLVGHSMGGAVSLALAFRHPGAVRALGLIAPYTQPIDQPPEPLKGLVIPAVLRPLIAWTIAVPLSMRTGRAKTVAVFAPDPLPEDFPIKAGGALAIRPASFQMGCYEIEMAPEVMKAQAPRYGEIAIPVSILYGRQDALLDPELHGRKTASAIPNGAVEMLDGGHMLPVTHVDATEAWLRKL